MKRFLPVLAYVGLLLLVLIGSVVIAQTDDLPTRADLEAGWNQIDPGGDTICSNGTPYSFFARPAESNDLLIYFQGGGACWFGENCDLTASPTYDPFVDETDNPAFVAAEGNSSAQGIFDLENPENPVADYNMVFVPYCTADVHIGNTTTTYEVAATDDVAAHEVTIFHNGYVNATTVLDWTFANFDAPDNIFVAGSSAGSIPSPFYTALVAEQYPDAHIAQLGDASGGYRSNAGPLLFSNWGTVGILPDMPEYDDVTVDNLTFETFYVASGSRFPDINFTQYNTAHDSTQYFFLSLIGITGTPLPDLLKANFADITAAIDNFDTYTAAGDLHTILGRSEFYEFEVDGLRFVDWVAALLAGDDVDTVECTACEPET